jgi:hypothetical protein
MATTTKVSCQISSSDTACVLGLEIWLDNQKIFDQVYVQDSISFNHEFQTSADSQQDHELCFVMKNKLPEHTKLDNNSNIIKDAVLEITRLAINEIELGNMVTELMTYTHDYNGTGQPVQDRFYSVMGCNGTVSLRFSTPFHIWLLQNM